MRAIVTPAAIMLVAGGASAATIGFEEVDFSDCPPYCTEKVVTDGYIFNISKPDGISASFEGGNGSLGVIGSSLRITRVDGFAFSLDRIAGFFAPFEDLQSDVIFVMAGRLGHHNPVWVPISAENDFSFDATGPFDAGPVSDSLTYFSFSVAGPVDGSLVLDELELTVAPSPVALPPTAGLLMAGLAGLGLMRWRQA